ncbi:MAG TPA: hypothetical protein VFC96_06885, partial [Anaerovoracaceae bacterium]|nr:hypothetical protein [Anaerovoracaceae bacterium]
TQYYGLEKLINISAKVKGAVAGEYELGLNVGEFDDILAAKMGKAGLEFAYHTLRLREGVDTRFDPNQRLATLNAISKSTLNLVSLVEPLGVEHTNEEIADNFLVAMKYGATVTGCMERIPVEGTPLGKYPAISERRLAQVIAVTRLAAGYHAPDICVHRATELAMEWGANVAVVETGAIPRDACCSFNSQWKGFDPGTAKRWFESKGYRVFSGPKKNKGTIIRGEAK